MNINITLPGFEGFLIKNVKEADEVGQKYLNTTWELPDVIAIDESKGDTDGKTYQTIIADPINRHLEILKDRKKRDG